MKKGLILASGNIENLDMLREQIDSHDYILCVDGGVRHIYHMDIKVDAIIGDLDSVDDGFPEFINKNSIPIIKYPIEKDETDTQLAIEHLIKQQCGEITLMGVIGSRMDHTLANILLLKRINSSNVTGKIINENNLIVLGKDYQKIKREDNHYVSIIPITLSGAVVTLRGFYYSIEDSHIEYGSTLGISNKIIDNEGEIFIKDGQALIISAKD